MSSTTPPPPPTPNPAGAVPGGLPLRWVVILMLAMIVGLGVGGLTYVESGKVAAAILAGLAAAGATTGGAHAVIAG